MANRLANATSPYLLQHAENPVDWWEWGPPSLAEAHRRDVPILLSIGYAACHWCHVMAHESFEDARVAAAINGALVPVKVDREERPDLDAIYMNATTALTGAGGWPMTCVLTPDGEPFYAATYLPKAQVLALVAAVSEAWQKRREDVLTSSGRIAAALRSAVAASTGAVASLGAEQMREAAARLEGEFDWENGGFGRAPKFPPSMVLEALLREHARTGSMSALNMVERTCEAMARGGIYDQLAGGFARYSVDARWAVPHFEKMLYDNAQLMTLYLHLFRATGSPLAERICRETADFLIRDLGTREGGFASSLDADTDGAEGLTYVWTPAQLVEVLGEADGQAAARSLEVTPSGTFEHGTSTLQLLLDPVDPSWWQRVRAELLDARARRPQPARDDKVVTAWNGLAIGALAEAGALLHEERLVEAARRRADLLIRVHLVDGRLRRTSRDGRVGEADAVAEDYGNLAAGLLSLAQSSAEPSWLESAGRLLEVALSRYADGSGAFYDNAADASTLFMRPRSLGDNAEPCGTSALAGALLTYSALTGSRRHRDAAEAAVGAMSAVATREPRFAGRALATASALLAGPVQVAVAGDGPAAQRFTDIAWHATSPGMVLATGRPDTPGVPLLANRPLIGGVPTAYVCRGFVCDAPTTDPQVLREQLATAGGVAP